MSAARLLELRLRNFKSVGDVEQTIDLRPLTILLGPNNSGKSTILQALLLLKQTLADPRPEVQLSLQGPYVEASSLRELTHGWPADMTDRGPEIALRWFSTVDAHRVVETGRRPINLSKLGAEHKIAWLSSPRTEIRLITTLRLCYRELGAIIAAQAISLTSHHEDPREPNPQLTLTGDGTEYNTKRWARADGTDYPKRESSSGLSDLYVHHFLPYIVPSRDADEEERRFTRLFRLLYEQPLDDLKEILSGLSYIGAVRAEPQATYKKPFSAPTRDVLANGAKAPELVYARQSDRVHITPLISADRSEEHVTLPDRISSGPLKDLVDDVLRHLGLDGSLSFVDVQELGVFRLLFGGASLQHVGRGIGYVLPVIVAGLVTDPLLGEDLAQDLALAAYLARCSHNPCLVFEELESHLHPKAQTRLAHFMVALARSGRQVIIETHSDHMVRRLRGLIARSARGSESEQWLLDSVRVLEIEQDERRSTVVYKAELTREGEIERWPAGFMDEATEEEESIYFARMKKLAARAPLAEEEYVRNVHFKEVKG